MPPRNLNKKSASDKSKKKLPDALRGRGKAAQRSANPPPPRKQDVLQDVGYHQLSPAHERFVGEFLIDRNPEAAARRAGYTGSGMGLLNNCQIAALIRRREQKIAENANVTAERTLKEIARIAFSDIRDLCYQDGNLKPIHELDDETAATVASIEVFEEYLGGKEKVYIGRTKKVRFWDKNEALNMLAKRFGLIKDRINVKLDAALGIPVDQEADVVDLDGFFDMLPLEMQGQFLDYLRAQQQKKLPAPGAETVDHELLQNQ